VVKSRSMNSDQPNQVPSEQASQSTLTSPGPAASTPVSGLAQNAAQLSPTFSPLYQQIKSLITQSLQSGEWKPGELIPSEIDLAVRFKVSQGTVRKAIDELSAENVVVRRQGKGTFVATHHEARSQFRFLRLKPDQGVQRYPTSKFVEVKRIRAPGEIARLLEIKMGDSVVFIRRVQSFDGVPTILEELWLPGAIFKGLTAELLNEYKGPMYALFETEFGTHMIRASEQLRAISATAAEAELLKIETGTPLLNVERVSYTYGDKPVEYRRGMYITALHHYQNELS
jgi:GntR family transcriptional regulator